MEDQQAPASDAGAPPAAPPPAPAPTPPPPQPPAPPAPTPAPAASSTGPHGATPATERDAPTSQVTVVLRDNTLTWSGLPPSAVLETRLSGDTDWNTAKPSINEMQGWLNWRYSSDAQGSGSGRIRVSISVANIEG